MDCTEASPLVSVPLPITQSPSKIEISYSRVTECIILTVTSKAGAKIKLMVVVGLLNT